jgi:U4/U6.U5 tri-snRNP-associated protein 2
LANVTHESVASITRDKTDTAWKLVLRAPPLPSSSNTDQAGIEGEERWIGIQDLIVEDIRKEMIFLGEAVLQVWERRDLAEAQSGGKKAASGDQEMDVDS